MFEKVLITDLNQKNEYQQILDGQPGTFGMRSGRVYLQPGEACGQHSTNSNEEMLVFLSGQGQLLIGRENKAYQVSKGKVCYIPPNTTHNIKNISVEPLTYIYCVAPVNQKGESK